MSILLANRVYADNPSEFHEASVSIRKWFRERVLRSIER
jgi:hypothetical protein